MSVVTPPLTLPAVGSIAIFQTLLTIPEAVEAFGNRMLNMPFAPELTAYPFLLHHAEPGGDGYGLTLGSFRRPESWRGRYVVRMECEGESIASLLSAQYAIQGRLASGSLVAPDGYFVTAEPLEPWPQILGAGSMEEGGSIFSQTGDFYTLEVLNLGA